MLDYSGGPSVTTRALKSARETKKAEPWDVRKAGLAGLC